MYYISKRFEISASHALSLKQGTACCRPHGHNWIITVFCKAATLNEDGMVADFTAVKRLIHDQLDHQVLNEILPCNPTAENIARWIADQIPTCYKVEVKETESNTAVYEKD